MANKNQQLTENLNTVEECRAAIAEVNKKFRMTMYGVIACVVAYLVALFWIRNTTIVFIICIPMLILAVMNNRYGKQIRQIAARRDQIRQEEARVQQETGSGDAQVVELDSSDIHETVSDAKSLDDLPKEYTVLDQVTINDEPPIAHVIVSPYGVAIVDNKDWTEEIRTLLSDLNLDFPIYYYEPVSDDQIFDLAARIQQPHQTVLSEPEIYKILYRLSGIA